jgi:hypothetical protein
VLEGDKNSARYPDYHKLDIRIDKQFVFDSWSFSIYLDLWNVYNRDNIISYSFKADENGVLSSTPRYDMGIAPRFCQLNNLKIVIELKINNILARRFIETSGVW